MKGIRNPSAGIVPTEDSSNEENGFIIQVKDDGNIVTKRLIHGEKDSRRRL